MLARSTAARLATLIAITALLVAPATASARRSDDVGLTGPVFGLATAPAGGLLVADAGAGVVLLRRGGGQLLAELPNVTDVAPIGLASMFAVTGGGPGDTDGQLWRVSPGRTARWADVSGFEARVNPDGGEIDSNPFDVAALRGGKALIADAGANAVLISTRKGRLDWVATLPSEVVSTAYVKGLAGCPTPVDPEAAFVCDLPDEMPAQAVPTSVVVGPDGAWYVSELKGFPAPPGEARVWRIERGTRHAECGASDRCSVVIDGLTAAVDLAFTPRGALDVVELDEGGPYPFEFGSPPLGGTVDRCSVETGVCTELATGLTMPIGVAERGPTTYVLVNALIPGAAEVITLP